MKVAVTVFGSTISPLCDTARQLLLVEVVAGEVRRLGQQPIAELDLSERMQLLSESGVQVLLCGAISGFFHHALQERGIRVYPWVSGEVDDVLAVFALRAAAPRTGQVAVTADGPGLEAAVAPSFGRCSHCLIVAVEQGRPEVVEAITDDVGQPGFRGCVSLTRRLVAHGAGVVLTGRCGPNAYGVLAAAGVEVVLGVEGRVGQAVKRYLAGRLRPPGDTAPLPTLVRARGRGGAGRRGGGGGRNRGEGNRRRRRGSAPRHEGKE